MAYYIRYIYVTQWNKRLHVSMWSVFVASGYHILKTSNISHPCVKQLLARSPDELPNHRYPQQCFCRLTSSREAVNTVDGRNPTNLLRLVVYPIINKVFIHPRWCRISSIHSITVTVLTYNLVYIYRFIDDVLLIPNLKRLRCLSPTFLKGFLSCKMVTKNFSLIHLTISKVEGRWCLDHPRVAPIASHNYSHLCPTCRISLVLAKHFEQQILLDCFNFRVISKHILMFFEETFAWSNLSNNSRIWTMLGHQVYSRNINWWYRVSKGSVNNNCSSNISCCYVQLPTWLLGWSFPPKKTPCVGGFFLHSPRNVAIFFESNEGTPFGNPR